MAGLAHALAFGRSADLGTSESRRRLVAYAVYLPCALLSVGAAVALGRTWALAILLTLPILIVWRRNAITFAAALVAGGVALRLAFAFSGVYTDGIEAAQLAWRDVLAGQNPYGHVLAGASQSNTIYPYGPLALIAYIPAYWTEIVAAAAMLVVLARERAWITLAFTASFPFLVRATVNGQNDVLPCLLILLAVLAARRSTRRAAVFLALAVAIKPYAAAWVPPLIGLGGLDALVVFGALSAVLWSPVLLVWSPRSFLESERLQLTHHPDTGIALNVPPLQLLAAPLSLLALRVRSWQAMFWLGLAIFLVFLYFSPWAGWGYIEGIAPAAMLLLEMGLVREGLLPKADSRS